MVEFLAKIRGKFKQIKLEVGGKREFKKRIPLLTVPPA